LLKLTDEQLRASYERKMSVGEYVSEQDNHLLGLRVLADDIEKRVLAKVARMLSGLALSKGILTDIMAREIMANRENVLKTVLSIAREAARQQLEAVKKALEE